MSEMEVENKLYFTKVGSSVLVNGKNVFKYSIKLYFVDGVMVEGFLNAVDVILE